uniref:hypothetical protein n=1 Tax=Candidatus Ichthyocystis hellenicum TaxID=1561003 RepID=UPI001584EA16
AVNRKMMTAASEHRESLELALVNAMVSATEYESPVLDVSGNATTNMAKLNPRSLEKLRFLELFIIDFCLNPDSIKSYTSSLLEILSFDTEHTSAKVLSDSKDLLRHFNHPQCGQISQTLSIKVESKINALSEEIGVFLEETNEIQPGDTELFFEKLTDILRKASVELIHLPDGAISLNELLEKSAASVSSEKSLTLVGKILSGKWIKTAKKAIAKLGKTSSSLLPQELLDMFSAFEKAIFKKLPSRMSLRSSQTVSFNEGNFTEADVRNAVLSTLGFGCSSEYKYSYHRDKDLPSHYVELIQGKLLPLTSSDIVEEFVVNGTKYELPATLLKDLARSSYRIGEDEVSTSRIVDFDPRNERGMQRALGTQFIEGAVKLGLTREAIETCASIMNQAVAAMMLDTGWVPNHTMFPPRSGLGIAPTLSEDTVLTLEKSESGEYIVNVSVYGHGMILHGQEKRKLLVDVTTNPTEHRNSIIAIVPMDPELSSVVRGIELRSSLSLRINQDGSAEALKIQYQAPNLSPEKISKICNSEEMAQYLHF